MNTHASLLRLGAVLGVVTGVGLVLVTSALPGCIDFGDRPLVGPLDFGQDGAVNTCAARAGTCTNGSDFFQPCGPTADWAYDLVCPTSSYPATTCCVERSGCGSKGGSCQGPGGSCNGDVLPNLCPNEQNCCVDRTSYDDAAAANPASDGAADASDDAAGDGGDPDAADGSD